MHEVSLVRELNRLVEQEAAVRHFSKVERVHVSLGAHACVSETSLRFAFESLRVGIMAEAELDVRMVQAKGVCHACGARAVMVERISQCAACGGVMLPQGGDEMRITELEVI